MAAIHFVRPNFRLPIRIIDEFCLQKTANLQDFIIDRQKSLMPLLFYFLSKEPTYEI